jgi:uncharacterized protein with GYD domain
LLPATGRLPDAAGRVNSADAAEHSARKFGWIRQPGRAAMVTYVVLGNFTDQGIRAAKDSPKRAEAFKKMAETFGITVKELFWTQGRYDVVTVLDAPDEASAMTLSLSLGALGNVRTESLRAFSAADMTKVVGKML